MTPSLGIPANTSKRSTLLLPTTDYSEEAVGYQHKWYSLVFSSHSRLLAQAMQLGKHLTILAACLGILPSTINWLSPTQVTAGHKKVTQNSSVCT